MSHTQLSNNDCEKYLIFKLDNKEYAVEVSMIKEVIHYTDMTEVPNTYSYVSGVISLRGMVIPILDFREYIGLTGTSLTKKTRIVIMHNNDDLLIGLLVDSIEEVINVSSELFIPVPDFIGKENMRFFKSAFQHNNKFILLIETGISQL